MADVRIVSTTPCTCCGSGPPSAVLLCSNRGGEASLCGMPEYGTPSVPARYFRTESVGGGSTACGFFGTFCGTFRESDQNEYSGSYGYGPDCILLPNTAQQIRRRGFISCGSYEEEEINGWTPGTGLFAFGTGIFTRTPTREEIVITSTSCTISGGFSFFASGTVYSELTNEDFPADAIARVIAAGWSEYAPSSACQSAKSQHTTGRTFLYQEARWKVQATGLTPGSLYNVTLQTFRRPVGGGDWEPYATSTTSHTAGPGGTFEFTGDVPFEDGFYFYVSGDVVIVPA